MRETSLLHHSPTSLEAIHRAIQALTAARNNEPARVIPFSFGSGVLPIVTVEAGQALLFASVRIVTPFDDLAASIELGTVSDPTLVCAPSETRPAQLGQYEFPAIVLFPATEPLQLIVSPGVSTQGAGVLVFSLQGV